MRLSLAAAAVLAALTVTLIDTAGFSQGSRLLFVALAGVSILCAAGLGAEPIARATRLPVTRTLAAIAAVSLLSTIWTVSGPASSARWAMVLAGYAAVAVCAQVVTGRIGAMWLTTALLVFAAGEAALGLVAVANHALPDAERIHGVWRPGGTFEYQPSLALLEAAAVLPLRHQLTSHLRWRALAAAGAAVLIGAGLGLSGDRLAPALVAAALVWKLVVDQRTARRDGRGGQRELAASLGAAALLLAGAALSPLIFGTQVSAGAAGAGGRGIAELAGICAAGALVWWAVCWIRDARFATVTTVAACLLAAGALLVSHHGAAAVTTGGTPAHGVQHSSGGFLHGRAAEWQAALQTWWDRPLLGSGADSYYVASFHHQPAALSLYAHDLPLEFAAELGIAGLLLAIALYAAVARLLWRSRHSASFPLLAPLCSFFLVSNLLDWTWHFAAFGALWAAGCGALAASRSPAPDGRTGPSQPADQHPARAR